MSTQIFSMLLGNGTAGLAKVVTLFVGRGIEIHSLSLQPVHPGQGSAGLASVTAVLGIGSRPAGQVVRQLDRLVDVHEARVLDAQPGYSPHGPLGSVDRERLGA